MRAASSRGRGVSGPEKRWVSKLARAFWLVVASGDEGFINQVSGVPSLGLEIQEQGPHPTAQIPLLSHFAGEETEAKSNRNFRMQLVAELGFGLVTKAATLTACSWAGLSGELTGPREGFSGQWAGAAVSLWMEAGATGRKGEVRPKKGCRKFSSQQPPLQGQ